MRSHNFMVGHLPYGALRAVTPKDKLRGGSGTLLALLLLLGYASWKWRGPSETVDRATLATLISRWKWEWRWERETGVALLVSFASSSSIVSRYWRDPSLFSFPLLSHLGPFP